MSKYIKLDETVNALIELEAKLGSQQQAKRGVRFAIGYMKDLPTIEVSEDCISRAEGKWVEDGCYPYYVCSNCGQVCEKQCNGVEIEPLFTKYCPNCGARMESDGE